MTYELINAETANSLAAFPSRAEAEEAWARLAASDERFAQDLVIVAFDDEGLAVADGESQASSPVAEVVESFASRSPSVGA